MHPFIELMDMIENPGTFSTSGELDVSLPGMFIKGVGEISLPLPEEQARKIIAACEQAPFGRSEETVYDTSVRKVWQMGPEKVEIRNPAWNKVLAKECTHIAEKLGLHDSRVKFDLYKLLVYEKGSFFTPHRDTEKIPNMFATMVINLPSAHEGGELIVSHGGETCEYSFGGEFKFQPEYATFYADCCHEVKPVSEGYRFSLVYNLAIEDRQRQPCLSEQENIMAKVDQYIGAWAKKSGDNPFFTYLLDHSYSEKNLLLSNLKNSDYSKASILLKAAEKNNCRGFLCLVTYAEESYGECCSNYGGYDDADESDYEEYEVTSQEFYAHQLRTLSGETIPVESLALEEDQILAEIPLLDGPGRTVSISEATGNEGATKELWYHRGAIILWPESRDLEVATKTDIGYGMHYLKRFMHSKDLEEKKNREFAIHLAHHILDHRRHQDISTILNGLVDLGDIGIVRKLLNGRSDRSYYGREELKPELLVRVIRTFPWKVLEADLDTVLARISRLDASSGLSWLHNLLKELPKFLELQQFAIRWSKKLCEASVDRQLLTEFLKVVKLIGDHAFGDEAMKIIARFHQPLSLPSLYAPALIEVIESCKEETSGRDLLRRISEDFLKTADQHYPSPPKKPETYTRSGKLDCDCPFCQEVNTFLSDPQRSRLVLEKTLKRNLTHVEEEISNSRVDLTIAIDRQPPKFRGDVTKNQSSYQQALERYRTIQSSREDVAIWVESL